MILELKDWVLAQLPTYSPAIGEWQDSPATYERFIFAIQAHGGSPRVDVRYPNFRVLLLGPRNGRDKQLQVFADADKLVAATMAENAIIPCGAANLRALGEPTGPGLTTENRIWVSVPFEIIF